MQEDDEHGVNRDARDEIDFPWAKEAEARAKISSETPSRRKGRGDRRFEEDKENGPPIREGWSHPQRVPRDKRKKERKPWYFKLEADDGCEMGRRQRGREKDVQGRRDGRGEISFPSVEVECAN